MGFRRSPSFQLASLLFSLILFVGCGSTATVYEGGPAATSTHGATPTLAPTNTPVSSMACAGVTGFSGASAAGVSAHFPGITFLPGSLSTIAQTYETNGYQYQVVNLCTPGTTAEAIRAFFASSLPANGWTQTSTFPLRGDGGAACGDPYCWRIGGSPTVFAGLEFLSGEGQHGSLVTYNLRLIIPPLCTLSTNLPPAPDPFDLDHCALTSSSVDVTMPAAGAIALVATVPAQTGQVYTSALADVTYAQLASATYGSATLTITTLPGDPGTMVAGVRSRSGHYAKVRILAGMGGFAVEMQTYAFSF